MVPGLRKKETDKPQIEQTQNDFSEISNFKEDLKSPRSASRCSQFN